MRQGTKPGNLIRVSLTHPQTDQMILQYHCGRVFKRIFCADRAGVVVHRLAKQKSQLE